MVYCPDCPRGVLLKLGSEMYRLTKMVAGVYKPCCISCGEVRLGLYGGHKADCPLRAVAAFIVDSRIRPLMPRNPMQPLLDIAHFVSTQAWQVASDMLIQGYAQVEFVYPPLRRGRCACHDEPMIRCLSCGHSCCASWNMCSWCGKSMGTLDERIRQRTWRQRT